MMQRLVLYALLVTFVVITGSCSKMGKNTSTDCFSNTTTTRVIANAEGLVVFLTGVYYIIEKNTINSQLLPCNLAAEFKADKLPVRFSGEVKGTVSNIPAGTNNFVVVKMSK